MSRHIRVPHKIRYTQIVSAALGDADYSDALAFNSGDQLLQFFGSEPSRFGFEEVFEENFQRASSLRINGFRLGPFRVARVRKNNSVGRVVEVPVVVSKQENAILRFQPPEVRNLQRYRSEFRTRLQVSLCNAPISVQVVRAQTVD